MLNIDYQVFELICAKAGAKVKKTSAIKFIHFLNLPALSGGRSDNFILQKLTGV
jgi:hypothetical protein